jgi:hypothetical protein
MGGQQDLRKLETHLGYRENPQTATNGLLMQ